MANHQSLAPPEKLEELRKNYYESRERARQTKTESADLPFLAAASVLYYFDPNMLRPAGIAVREPGWENFLQYCEPVATASNSNTWRLTTIARQSALRTLAKEEVMLKALEPNQAIKPDVRGQLFLEMILKRVPITDIPLTRNDLTIFSEVCLWFDKILPVQSYRAYITKSIPMADLLAPMHKLASNTFVGRIAELEELAHYVGLPNDGEGWFSASARSLIRYVTDLTANPPLLVFGPGGMGKSSLLAKFILQTSSRKDVVPFVYLDVDRSVLDLENPASFILEAANQLSVQCPEQQPALEKFQAYIRGVLQSSDKTRASHSFNYEESLAPEFGEIVKTIKSPVLFVVDTFEEAQYVGKEVVDRIWRMLADLQRTAPNVRTIVGGRSAIKEFKVKEMNLGELKEQDARELVTNLLAASGITAKKLKTLADEIIEMVGRNPLSLRLAGEIVKQQGLEKLKKVETKTWLILKVRSEIVQARLYGRILAHIHDPNVKKLAYPGLIVRRITPEIIFHVLAGPCKLELKSLNDAVMLYTSFAKEVALVREEHNALVHRQDVRKIMLGDLVKEVPEQTIRNIHESAVRFYEPQADSISRAEEIYHRLLLGNSFPEIEKRWLSGVENYLRNALEELPHASRLWLSRKLQVTPDKELIKNADLESWEESTSVSVQRYLMSGMSDSALKQMSERKERTAGSKLFAFELEALRMQGKYKDALKQVQNFIPKALTSSKPEIIRELFMQAALINEALNKLVAALNFANEAEKMLGDQPNAIDALKVYVIKLRILRKKGEKFDEERKVVMDKVKPLLSDQTTVHQLRESPSLLREVVAETGKVMPELLSNAIDWIGIELISEKNVTTLAKSLQKWDEALKRPGEKHSEVSRRLGLVSDEPDKWTKYVRKNSGRSLSEGIQHLRKEVYYNTASADSLKSFDGSIIDIYRNTVEASIKTSNKESKPIKLDLS